MCYNISNAIIQVKNRMDQISSSSTTWEVEEENGQPKQVTRLQAARDAAKAELEVLKLKPWVNPQISSPPLKWW